MEWECESCGYKFKSGALLKMCPNCHEIGTVVRMKDS